MLKNLFLSFLLWVPIHAAPRLSQDFASILRPYTIQHKTRDFDLSSLDNSSVAPSVAPSIVPSIVPSVIPLGWMQGIQYLNPTCSGTSFAVTNIAMGVCVQDGNSSSYMQYVLVEPDSNPTVYIFYMDTFRDSICNQVSTHTLIGSIDPTMVCILDHGTDGLSKTVYYYPGSSPPPYPYNGLLTQYLSPNNQTNVTCLNTDTVLKTVILNPTTCFMNYNYNASQSWTNYQSYQTQCDSDHPIIYIMYADNDCTIPISGNNTVYMDNIVACEPATIYRQNGLPELYLVDDTAQYDYEKAQPICYTGPTVFVRRTLPSDFYSYKPFIFFTGFFVYVWAQLLAI